MAGILISGVTAGARNAIWLAVYSETVHEMYKLDLDERGVPAAGAGPSDVAAIA